MAQIVNITLASKLTGLSTYALRKGAKEGRFPAIRAGGTTNGKILFDLESLAQVLTNEAMASIKQAK
ncbi:hypothetical protein [Clostridium sp.]|uniref:hypothetical protein n=1 Tax=Clostridium sp. TaxID=1506 RepID=UPI002851DA8D|nr:hypothetical protein [Clostridium sp.]MDR3597087.1 hypothetical protein [Clostridium sp.]